jgi:hypothetical protein
VTGSTGVCEHSGIIRRLHTSLLLVNDLDLDALEASYGGPASIEHDGVQNLIALARDLRAVERALETMYDGRKRHIRPRRGGR